MSKDYSLAVIIPSYNKAKYISVCVESILSQTLLPDEIIIVDDLSTDNSREIIQKLCEKSDRIRPVFLEKNGGVSHARNTGIKNAKSEYITFVDADDYYADINKLKNEMMLIKRHREDIVAYSKVMQVNEDGTSCNIVLPDKKGYLEGDIYTRMLTGNFNFTTIARDYCVKKSIVLKAGGFDENKSLYEDLELTIKIAKEYPFYCTYELGTAYRQVDNGLSKEKKEEHIRIRKQIFKEFVKEHTMLLRLWYYLLWYCQKLKKKMQMCYWDFKNLIKKMIGRK